MSNIYISLRKDKSFHTIIIKKKIKEFTYLAAIGYAGGGVYEEFFGKLKYDQVSTDKSIPSTGIIGVWTDSLGSDEWREKINDVIINDDSERFEAQIEDLYEFMEVDDANIQIMLSEEIRNFIYVWYDEETSTEYETPLIKEIDFSALGFLEYEEPSTGYIISNEDWDNDFMEITSSNIWRLSHHFPSMIEDYLQNYNKLLYSADEEVKSDGEGSDWNISSCRIVDQNDIDLILPDQLKKLGCIFTEGCKKT